MGLFDRLGEHGSVLQSKRKMHLFYFTYLNQILNSKDASKDMLFGGLGSLNQTKLETCPFDDNLEQRINYLLDTVNDVLPTMRLAGRGANLEVSSIRKVKPTLPYREDYWKYWGQRNSIEIGRLTSHPYGWEDGWAYNWDGNNRLFGSWSEYLRRWRNVEGGWGWRGWSHDGINIRDTNCLSANSPNNKATNVKSALLLNKSNSGLREYENVRVDGVEVHHPFEKNGWRDIQGALEVRNYDRILFFPRIRCPLDWTYIYRVHSSPGFIVFIPENMAANKTRVIEIGNRGGGYYGGNLNRQQISNFNMSFQRYKTSLAYLERHINEHTTSNIFNLQGKQNEKKNNFLHRTKNEFSVIEIRLNKGIRNMLINWPHGMDE